MRHEEFFLGVLFGIGLALLYWRCPSPRNADALQPPEAVGAGNVVEVNFAKGA
jgi:hypothetical protein